MTPSSFRQLSLLAALLAMQCASKGTPDAGEREEEGTGRSGHQGMDMGGAPVDAGVHGYAAVQVDTSRLAPLGVSTALVEEVEVMRPLRTVGLVTVDETRTAHVHSKVRGWIDGIAVNFIGRQVKEGEVLCNIYSQEVYAAEIELLAVLAGGGPVLAAARRRLALWDVPKSEIARLERTREPRRTFALLAPRAGTVIAKQALDGMYVDASVELYTVSDLSRVWVLADVYDADVPIVSEGVTGRLHVEGVKEPLVAKADFLYPTIDEVTRTRKIRFELDNERRALLPGAFVTIELELKLGRGLVVPENAVIRTGTRSIVFIAHGDPPTHFEPREVTLGTLAGDRYVVEGGLTAGERVATGAQFLLDSESRVRASSMKGAGHGGH